MPDTLQDRVNAAYDACAPHDEALPSHALPEGEAAAWLADWQAAGGLPPAQQVLDVGCGTGVFTRWLAQQGHAVMGLDPSHGMLQVARAQGDAGGRVRYALGDGGADEAFAAGGFDAIVSRQAVGYLPDPLAAFGRWHRWLRPGGEVRVIDGLWSRADWNDEALVDARPLACVQNRALLPYLLTQSGFEITACAWLDQVNALHASDSPRYIVAARKPAP